MRKLTEDCYVDVSGWTKEEVKQAAEVFKEAVGAAEIGDLRVSSEYHYLYYNKEDGVIWVGRDYHLGRDGSTVSLTKSDFFSLAQNTSKNDDSHDLIQSLKMADKALLEAQKAYEKALNDVRQELGDGWVVERKERVVEDMTDPANWKPGDLIECLDNSIGGGFTEGKRYTYSGVTEYGSCGVMEDDVGDSNGWSYEYFKWHSRPNN